MEWLSSIVVIHLLVGFITVFHIQGVATDTMVLSLKGAAIANDGYVDVNDIGEYDDALHCHTNKTDCCVYSRAGEWFFPNGSRVQTKGEAHYYYSSRDYYYRNRGHRIVRLNRFNDPSEKGHFHCEVPNASDELQITYVNISM